MQVRFVVLVHDGKKLFHVSTHDVNAIRHGWIRTASNARHAYKTMNHIGSGLVIAMVNTDYCGWHDDYIDGEYSKEFDAYLEKKLELISKYEMLGYTNVGEKLRVSNGVNPNTSYTGDWYSTFNVNNMNKAKIFDKIKKLNLSLQMDIPSTLVNKAYLEIVKPYRSISFKVENMLSLLRFIRIELGLEEDLRKAV